MSYTYGEARKIPSLAQQEIAGRLQAEAQLRNRGGWVLALLALAFVTFQVCRKGRS